MTSALLVLAWTALAELILLVFYVRFGGNRAKA
jgi:hypothetical protein